MIPGLHCHVRAIFAQVLLGAWFVYSGGQKIFVSGLDRFTYDISNYKMVSAPWDAAIAYTVPWLEIVAGACLVIGILRRGALLAISILVTMFAIAIGWAWFHKLDITCGCHGGDAPIQYWAKAAEFAGYYIVLAWLWFADRPREIILPEA
jgi:uncharacterized membrane protein YphA (DoxX/SURF4 family)